MHKVNAGLTVLVALQVDRVADATALLRALDVDQARLPFARSTTTHFATITVIPAQPYRDETLPATLLFATSYCGPTRVHVDELVRVLGPGLREVLACCQGFDPACDDVISEPPPVLTGHLTVLPPNRQPRRWLPDHPYLKKAEESSSFAGSERRGYASLFLTHAAYALYFLLLLR